MSVATRYQIDIILRKSSGAGLSEAGGMQPGVRWETGGQTTILSSSVISPSHNRGLPRVPSIL
ncbi:hypothetical protein EMIT043CA1_160096 [Pseudomonas brassicacearum]